MVTLERGGQVGQTGHGAQTAPGWEPPTGSLDQGSVHPDLGGQAVDVVAVGPGDEEPVFGEGVPEDRVGRPRTGDALGHHSPAQHLADGGEVVRRPGALPTQDLAVSEFRDDEDQGQDDCGGGCDAQEVRE